MLQIIACYTFCSFVQNMSKLRQKYLIYAQK